MSVWTQICCQKLVVQQLYFTKRAESSHQADSSSKCTADFYLFISIKSASSPSCCPRPRLFLIPTLPFSPTTVPFFHSAVPL